MRAIRVLRLETSHGTGVYIACYNALHPASHRPSPWDDNLTNWNSQFIFGFATIDQLLAWTTDEYGEDELVNLAQQGIGLAEYEARELCKGDHQVAFIPEKRLCWIPLSELVA